MAQRRLFTLFACTIMLTGAFGSAMVAAFAEESTPASTPSLQIVPADAGQVQAAQDSAVTEGHRRILEDGIVTDDELRESLQGYFSCLDDAGFRVTLVSNGVIGQGYMVTGPVSTVVIATPAESSTPDMTFHRVETECYTTTRLPIEGLYMGQMVITDVSPEELLVGCLETSDVIELGSVKVEDAVSDLDLQDTDTVICMAYPHYRGGSIEIQQPLATPET